MTPFVIGVNHRTTPLPIREKLHVSDSRIPELLQTLLHRGYLDEGVLLSTCNRLELYGENSSNSFIGLQRFLSERAGLRLEDLEGCWYGYSEEGAVRHLFRVASGLDSMIFGEAEIQGQVRRAYEIARTHGATGAVTHRLFEKSLNAAKRVREMTHITTGKASIGSYAVDVAEKIFGGTLPSKKLLILGAGEIGRLVGRHFSARGVASIWVASRSRDRATTAAECIGAEAVTFEAIHRFLPECDIVIGSTKCPTILLHRDAADAALRKRHGNPIFFIDLSIPRNIDPSITGLPNAYLYHLDDLEKMAAKTIAGREAELSHCEAILSQKVSYFMRWLENISQEAKRQNSKKLCLLPAS